MDNYVVLVAYIAVLCAALTLGAFAAEWLERNPYSVSAGILSKLFRFFGN